MGAQLADSDIEQIKTAMTYFLKHNKEHIKDITKWLQKADDFKLNEIAEDLKKIIELSEEISGHFEVTIKTLESYR